MRTRHLIPLLAACSAIGTVGNYLFLPALPQIGAYYQVLPGTAQLTVTAYMISFAIGVLLSGPLADRFGRRPILIGGVAITAVGALLCYIAPTMSWFVAARVLQGAAGGFGITVSRATVGDLALAVTALRQVVAELLADHARPILHVDPRVRPAVRVRRAVLVDVRVRARGVRRTRLRGSVRRIDRRGGIVITARREDERGRNKKAAAEQCN